MGFFVGYDYWNPVYIVYSSDRIVVRSVRCVEFSDVHSQYGDDGNDPIYLQANSDIVEKQSENIPNKNVLKTSCQNLQWAWNSML